MSSVQSYARAAGIMFLISLVAGSFGEFYVPSKLIVAGNAAATVSNILDHEMLFRLGFAGYLLEALCDVALALVLYVLLKPVHRNLALLSAFFGLVSTALFAVCEMFLFCAPLLVRNPAFAQTVGSGPVHGVLRLGFTPSGISDISLGLSAALYRRAIRARRCGIRRQELHLGAGTGLLVGLAADSGADCCSSADGVVSHQGCRCRQMERARHWYAGGQSTVACLMP